MIKSKLLSSKDRDYALSLSLSLSPSRKREDLGNELAFKQSFNYFNAFRCDDFRNEIRRNKAAMIMYHSGWGWNIIERSIWLPVVAKTEFY